MSSGRPEYAIVIAVLGILFAIGVPSLQRGQFILGAMCIAGAAVVASLWLIELWRTRR